MVKIVLLLAIVVVAVLLVRKLMRFTSAQQRGEASNDPGDLPAGPPDAKLVRCVECGAFVPKAETLPAPTGFRCGGAGCAKPR